LNGSYICTEYNDYLKKNDFRTLKFTDSSIVFKSSRIYEELNNNKIAQTVGVIDRYNTSENELVLEYILFRDFEIYNIFKYAKISITGDTLTFYKTENLQRLNEKKRVEKEEVYIYNPTLTSLPKLSNTK
jgi:hypothetical protein